MTWLTIVPIVSLFLVATLTFAFAALYLTERRRAHALFWCVGFAVFLLGGALVQFIGGGEHLRWVLFDLMGISLLLCLIGVLMWQDQPLPWRSLLYLVGVTGALQGLFLVLKLPPQALLWVAKGFVALLAGAMVWPLLRAEQATSGHRVAALFSISFVLLLIASLFVAAIGDARSSQTTQHTLLHLELAVLSAWLAGAGVLFLLGELLGQIHFGRSLADTDTLAGILNRHGFFKAAQQMLEQHPQSVVIICDLDHFKAINDHHGHEAGDQAIQHIADKLSHAMRSGDLLGRLGGAEFGIVLKRANLAQARFIIERLRLQTEHQMFRSQVGAFFVTASFGLAQQTGATLSTLLKQADLALRQAKAAGRNQVRAYMETAADADALAGASAELPDADQAGSATSS